MASVGFKPGQRFNVSDWNDSNNFINSNAERSRVASHHIRQEARSLDLITANKTKWEQHDNNTRLDDRIDDITVWKEDLNRIIKDTNEEINALEDKKDGVEKCLQEKWLVNTDVTIECLNQREDRQEIDLVRDQVEAELLKENEIIEKLKAQLQIRIDESNEQVSLLREAKAQLENDVRDKVGAIAIDTKNLEMNNQTAEISYKPNSTRVPPESTTEQAWNQFSQYNKDRACAEIRASTTLREAVDATMATAKNELKAQRIATEYAYRKRIHEFEMQEKELVWQRERMMDEIAEMERDIRNIEQAILDKEGPSKLAQTRLEYRTYRRNVELCRDSTQKGLTAEVYQLQSTIESLKDKLAQQHHARYNLYQNLHRVEHDIELKRRSMKIDNKCLDIRRRLTVSPAEFVESQPRDEFTRTYTDQSTTDAMVKLKQLDLA